MNLIHQFRRTLYLMAGFEQLLGEQSLRTRAEMERLFVLALSSDAAGLPMLPAEQVVRLLPYLVPQILIWRRMATLQGELPAAPGGVC